MRAATLCRRAELDHDADELAQRKIETGPVDLDLTVGHHYDPIDVTGHLRESVRHHDDSGTVVRGLLELVHQPQRLTPWQVGRHLVDDDHVGALPPQPRDRDESAFAERKVAHQRSRIDRREADEVERLPCGTPLVRQTQDAPRPCASQEHVLGHGHVLDQAEILVHDTDRVSALAASHQLTAVWGQDTVQDLDERRLSRPVRAEQSDELADVEIEVDVAQDTVIAVRLVDPTNLERNAHGRPLTDLGSSRKVSSCPRAHRTSPSCLPASSCPRRRGTALRSPASPAIRPRRSSRPTARRR